MKMTKNGVAVIGIDHGYGNIKTANSVTPTGITAYDSKPTFEGNILCYDNKFYRIGEGHKAFLADKSEDEDFYICTLMGIAKELNNAGKTVADVHIAAGLPLTWVKAQRDSFRQYLTKNENVEFSFKDKDYNVRIVGCTVYPQGYTAVIDRLHDMTGQNMLADIGNGTMNVMYINNKKPIESKCSTEKFGVNQCVIKAKNTVMDRYGIVIDDVHIEQIIRTGSADIAPKYLDIIKAIMREYCSDIFNALRKYEYDPDLMRLYIVGGGSRLIQNFGRYEKDRVTPITDVCATAKGYEYLACQTLNKR